jgi:hypothetical protein
MTCALTTHAPPPPSAIALQWDFRNASAGDYYISSVLALVNNPNVDGVFTDDYATVTEEWLAARYEELQERPDETFDWARLHADHWVKSIQQEASSQREAKRRTM